MMKYVYAAIMMFTLVMFLIFAFVPRSGLTWELMSIPIVLCLMMEFIMWRSKKYY